MFLMFLLLFPHTWPMHTTAESRTITQNTDSWHQIGSLWISGSFFLAVSIQDAGGIIRQKTKKANVHSSKLNAPVRVSIIQLFRTSRQKGTFRGPHNASLSLSHCL